MRVRTFGWLVLVVVAFGLPLFLGLGRVDLENDEAIYSVAAESIVDHGDWLTPQTLAPGQEADFVEKPPLKFWLVAAPMRLGIVRDDEVGLRVWDATFGVCIFLYVFGLGRLIAGPWCGFTAALVLFAFEPLLLQHGLRTNNMDAAVVLAYCGGLYHYLRWCRAAGGRERAGHALAIALFCVLGFMTKFVAIAFLPMVIVVVSLLHPAVRSRLIGEWRTWATVAAVAFILAAPWFVYQSVHMGSKFWNIILLDHVFKRFSTGLDPTHLRPWNFYFVEFYLEMSRSHTFWLVALGAVLVLVRTVREKWLEGSLVLLWFALPISLMSLGSSKLFHYAYPFAPPLALSVGCLFGWLDRRVSELMIGRHAAPALGWLARVAVAVVLLAAGPAEAYRGTFPKLLVENHPLRTARDCMQNVRTYERREGQRQTPLFVFLPVGVYLHPYYYYFRNAGWDRHEGWGDEALGEILDVQGAQWAVLMPKRDYQIFLTRTNRSIGAGVPKVEVSNVVLLLPGPFAGCGSR
jgi:4-amino-4-deoxy-L-arabinose transferase-like glycosyltransferase